jgi:SAM-dependent methyltransferase
MRTLCNGSDRLYGTTHNSFLVVECRDCRLIRLYPWPTQREIKQYYPDNYWFDPTSGTADQLADVWRRFVLRDHVNFVRRALDDSGLDGPVLDVGCGGGLFLRELHLAPGRAFGLDFSVDAARVAWATNGVPVACGALPRSPFRRASFAAITMFHVLEHLYDPAAYMEAAHRLLVPGGRLIVQVPNAACWQFLLFGEAWNGLDIPRHLIDFKEQDLVNLLEYSGFEVLRRKHFSLRDNPAGLASTLAPELDPMARRIRRVKETDRIQLVKDLAYFGIVLASIPFALLEAACRAGSTIMLEARPRA